MGTEMIKVVFLTLILFQMSCATVPPEGYWEPRGFGVKCVDIEFSWSEERFHGNTLEYANWDRFSGPLIYSDWKGFSMKDFKELLERQGVVTSCKNEKEKVKVHLHRKAMPLSGMLNIMATILSFGVVPFSRRIPVDITVTQGMRKKSKKFVYEKKVSWWYLPDARRWNKRSKGLYGDSVNKVALIRDIALMIHQLE